MADKKMTQLAAPEAAIASYLDELLHTATSTALQEEQVQPEPAPPKVEARPQPDPGGRRTGKNRSKVCHQSPSSPRSFRHLLWNRKRPPVQTEAPVTAAGQRWRGENHDRPARTGRKSRLSA